MIESKNVDTEIETRTMSIKDAELRAVKSDGKHILSGYFALFNIWGSEVYGFKEKIEPGSFANTIPADDIRSLFNHDANWVLGRNKANTLTLREDAKGGLMEVEINPDDINAMSLFSKVSRGDVSGQSFSFRTIRDSWVYPDDPNALPERTLLEVKLFDVGPVTYPFYEMTDITAALRSMEINRKAIIPSGDADALSIAYKNVMRKHKLKLLEFER